MEVNKMKDREITIKVSIEYQKVLSILGIIIIILLIYGLGYESGYSEGFFGGYNSALEYCKGATGIC
jgi:hypothetical protein